MVPMLYDYITECIYFFIKMSMNQLLHIGSNTSKDYCDSKEGDLTYK